MGYYRGFGAQGDFYQAFNRKPALWGLLRAAPAWKAPKGTKETRAVRGDYYRRVMGDYYQRARGDFWSSAVKKVKKAVSVASKYVPSSASFNPNSANLASAKAALIQGAQMAVQKRMPGGSTILANLTGSNVAMQGQGGPVAIPSGNPLDAILGKTSIGKAIDVYKGIKGATDSVNIWPDSVYNIGFTKIPNANPVAQYDYGTGSDTAPVRLPGSPGSAPRRKRRKARCQKRRHVRLCKVHRKRHKCGKKRKHGHRVSFIDKKTGKRVTFIARK